MDSFQKGESVVALIDIGAIYRHPYYQFGKCLDLINTFRFKASDVIFYMIDLLLFMIPLVYCSAWSVSSHASTFWMTCLSCNPSLL